MERGRGTTDWLTYQRRIIDDTNKCLVCCPDVYWPTYVEPLKREIRSMADWFRQAFTTHTTIRCPTCREAYAETTRHATESVHPMWEELERVEERRNRVSERHLRTLARYQAELERFVDAAIPSGPADHAEAPTSPNADVSVQPDAVARTEDLGSELRIFNNIGSESDSTETLHISQVASFHLQFDSERTRSTDLEVQGGLPWAALKGVIEKQLVERHGRTIGTSLEVSQTSTISVPARRLVRVTIAWKRIWEDGLAIVGDPSHPILEVPYHVTTRLSYDKTTQDFSSLEEAEKSRR